MFLAILAMGLQLPTVGLRYSGSVDALMSDLVEGERCIATRPRARRGTAPRPCEYADAMHFEAANATEGTDWSTIIVALVAGLGSGVIGSLLTNWTQHRLARNTTKREAAKALWTFHRTLHDFALEAESHELRDGAHSFTNTTANEMELARQAAYPYRAWLGDKHIRLLTRQSIDDYGPITDPLAMSNDVWKWAQALEERLKVVFRGI